MQVLGINVAVWLVCTSPLFGASYYVSNSGDDENAGTAPTVAWSSLVKVNSFSFAPGDVICFECGGAWRGQLVPTSGSPEDAVTYTSYEKGPNVADLPHPKSASRFSKNKWAHRAEVTTVDAKPRFFGSVERHRPSGCQFIRSRRIC